MLFVVLENHRGYFELKTSFRYLMKIKGNKK